MVRTVEILRTGLSDLAVEQYSYMYEESSQTGAQAASTCLKTDMLPSLQHIRPCTRRRRATRQVFSF